GVGQIEPVLEKINTQHALNPDRSAAGTLGIRIERFDGLGELFPGNNALHVLQKLFLAGLLAELLKAIGEGLLLHVWKTQLWSTRCLIIAEIINKSEMPIFLAVVSLHDSR